jgi:PAS domain S-box-containing protein
MRAVVDQRFREATRQLLGQDIVGMPIHLSEVISHPLGGGPLAIRDWGAKKFVFYPDLGDNYVSFHDFCFRQIPEEVCEEILRSQNIGMVYEIGLVWEEQLFGMVGIFLSPDEELKDRKVVVSFLRQASIALARRQTENRLRLSEQRLRDIVDLSPLPAALIGSDARYTFVNGKFTETLGYTLHDIPDGKAWFSQAFPDSVQRKEAIIAWKDDPGRSQKGRMQPRTFDVRCKDGTKKTILFHPVTLRDGSHFVTYEDLTTPG